MSLRSLIVSWILALTLVAVPAAHVRAATVTVVVMPRTGVRATYAFSNLDTKRVTLSLKQGRTSVDLPLSSVAVLSFAPGDTARAAAPESLDVVALTDGRTWRGVVRKLDGKRATLLLTTGQESDIALKSVRRITFGKGVFDVDRRKFGGGFNLIGESTELSLSAGYAADVETGSPVVRDTAVSAYVTALGKRIAAASKRPGLDYAFTVVDSKQVNAFTVGGGHVFVYRGLIEQMGSESELAGVLAHEIGHNVGRHTAKQLSSTLLMQGVLTAGGELLSGGDAQRRAALQQYGGSLAYFATMKFSRDDEREADFLAVYNLHRLGYDPHAMVSAFETLQRNQDHDPSAYEVFFQTHPSLSERIQNTNAELPKLALAKPKQDTPQFQAMKRRLTGLPRPLMKKPLLDQKVDVPAGNHVAFALTLDPSGMQAATLVGQFTGAGGNGGDIRVLLFDAATYASWKAGQSVRPLWDSGRSASIHLAQPVAKAGDYVLAIDNTGSAFVGRSVAAELHLEYKE